MALRWFHFRFALVGAIGKACGEAPGVSVSGTPPVVGGTLPLILGIVIVFGHKKKRPAWGRCACGVD